VSRRDFRQAVVMVTGAGGGLGRALAHAWAAEGARVVVLDRDADAAAAVAAELAAHGADGHAIAADVTDESACRRAVAECVARHGRLDVLVANAGISHRSAYATTDPAVIRRVMDVNFFGAVNCTGAALPHLLASRGAIVAVSSVAGYTPLVARTGYAASKHALHGFYDSLRAELEPAGVDVTLVCPSFVATGIGRNALAGDGSPVRHAQVTVGRPLAPDLVAARVVDAVARRRRLLRVGATAHFAWWMSRFAPGWYARLMARRVRAELESGDGAADPAHDRGTAG
jgi:NAD(P)-dependent dehydrogenase (short-subunit alcohol dehydrogenase family)